MAALEVDAGFQIHAFPAYLAARLPEHARPLFLRLRPTLETTGTFKPVKADLVREGFDPTAVTDTLLVFDRVAGGYVALDSAAFSRILNGGVRL